jgi:hypothetical protein
VQVVTATAITHTLSAELLHIYKVNYYFARLHHNRLST